MPSLHLKLVLLLSEIFSSPGFCRDSCWEWSEYISQIYEQAWIYTYGYQARIYTHQYILVVKHEYALTNLYKKPAQSKASIISPSLISANFSSNVNWKFYRMFCLQTCFEFVKFYFYFSFFAGKVLVSRWDPVENDRLVFVHCGLVISVWIQQNAEQKLHSRNSNVWKNHNSFLCRI